MPNIIGVVVQPGVEFGDDEIFHYSRTKAAALSAWLERHPKIVLEGHSTDYQSPVHLKEMVEDGIAILKVGPALTFALRQGLFSLEAMERELVAKEQWSNFADVLDSTMTYKPDNWVKHYHGEPKDLELKRKYSFSDRIRYYLGQQPVLESMGKLFANMDGVRIPISMLQQYMPLQYRKVRDGRLNMQAKELVKDFVVVMIEDYNFAVKCSYDIGAMLR